MPFRQFVGTWSRILRSALQPIFEVLIFLVGILDVFNIFGKDNNK